MNTHSRAGVKHLRRYDNKTRNGYQRKHHIYSSAHPFRCKTTLTVNKKMLKAQKLKKKQKEE